MEQPNPAPFLPEAIRDVLRRKSSRDPASRFTTKLHVLLAYTAQNPDLHEKVGICWTTREEFRVNKQTLSSVMGIRLNSLNVNLRDHNFQQLGRNKDGWTRWRRSGFVRADIQAVALVNTPAIPNPVTFSLGRLGMAQLSQFWQDCSVVWTELFGRDTNRWEIPGAEAVERAAHYFKQAEQPLDNARDVLRAIMVQQGKGQALSFYEFSRLLAMFGPAYSLMFKIASLLTSSNSTGKWLTFDSQGAAVGIAQAYFDDAEPNCLVIRHYDGNEERVYNDPTMVHGTEAYLMDQRGRQYQTWEEYFKIHPVRTGDLRFLPMP
jgi:hypothetical protein